MVWDCGEVMGGVRENPPLIPFRSVSVHCRLYLNLWVFHRWQSATMRVYCTRGLILKPVWNSILPCGMEQIRTFKNQCSEAFGKTAPFNLVTAAIVADRFSQGIAM